MYDQEKDGGRGETGSFSGVGVGCHSGGGGRCLFGSVLIPSLLAAIFRRIGAGKQRPGGVRLSGPEEKGDRVCSLGSSFREREDRHHTPPLVHRQTVDYILDFWSSPLIMGPLFFGFRVLESWRWFGGNGRARRGEVINLGYIDLSFIPRLRAHPTPKQALGP